jgi:hypothetical protein
MPTIIRVNFRRDAHDDNGRIVRAFTEDLDLDPLTPRARTLAEALHDTMRHHPAGGRALDIVFESDLTNAELADLPPQVPDAYRPVKNPDEKALRTITWGPLLSAAYPTSLTEWLEAQARDKIPDGWYPIGAPHQPRVPSWKAGAADRYMSKSRMLEYLRTHGAELSAQAWDTLRPTPLLTPDRHVAGRPQWLPATAQAFADRPRELWPLSRVAGYLGLTDGSARVQLRRWGFTMESRAPGRGGEGLYAADLIEAAHHHRPKRGRPPKAASAEVPEF